MASTKNVVAPRNETEQKLVQVWAQVLDIEKVGVQDNFFEIGGDSILAIQIIVQCQRAGFQLTTKCFFENLTVERLAGVIDQRGDKEPENTDSSAACSTTSRKTNYSLAGLKKDTLKDLGSVLSSMRGKKK